MKHYFTKIFFILTMVSTLSIPVFVDAQWTAPTATPPSNNASAPLNTSGTAQVKLGGLTLGVGGVTNGLLIYSGNVGIGSMSPAYKLDVNGDTITRGWLRTTGAAGWYSETYGGGWYMEDSTWVRAYNSKSVYTPGEMQATTIRGNSNVCIGGDCRSSWPTSGITGESDTLGSVASRGSSAGVALYAPAFYYNSDESLKDNVAPLQGSLDKIRALGGVSFDWKKDGSKAIGLIAQDVEKVYPELVSEDANGIKSVQYGNLVAPLIEAIKEQQNQIDALKAEIEALKTKQ